MPRASDDVTLPALDDTLTRPTAARRALCLVIAWCREEPRRVGEVARVLEGGAWILGRDAGPGGVTEARLSFARQRPGRDEGGAPLACPRISRRQLVVTSNGRALQVRNEGGARLAVNGVEVQEAEIGPGDVLELWRELLLLVEDRPLILPPAAGPLHRFGRPDPAGLVGESPALWALRREIGVVAPLAGHVLITGPSGAGKELVAAAVHAASPRGRRALVARNAATFPRELVDAEIFGNRAGYPNPGMPERPGLVGEADGGTLFLDEIGEISHEVQAHLLRVLDGGEHHRLGEARARRVDLRLLGATNRPIEQLKPDFAARFSHHLTLPGLEARRSDIPLLVAWLLERAADEGLVPDAPPAVHPRLMTSLLRRPWDTHVRELRNLLWEALRRWRLEGGGAYLDAAEMLRAPPATHSIEYQVISTGEAGAPRPPRRDLSAITRDEILRAYARAGGVQAQVTRDLGLSSRFQLRRLEQRLGITAADRASAGGDPVDEGGG